MSTKIQQYIAQSGLANELIDQDVGRKKNGSYNARDVYQMMYRVYKNASRGELRPTTVYSAFANGVLGDLLKTHRQLTYGQVVDAAAADLTKWYTEVKVEPPIVRTRTRVNKKDLVSKVEDLERQVHRLRVSYHGEAVPPPQPVMRSGPKPKKEPRTYRITQMGRTYQQPQYVEVSQPSPSSPPEIKVVDVDDSAGVAVVPPDSVDQDNSAAITEVFGNGVTICRIETSAQRRRKKKPSAKAKDSTSGSGLLGGGLIGGGLLGGCSGLRRL